MYYSIITDIFILCYVIVTVMLHYVKMLLQICCEYVTDITYLLELLQICYNYFDGHRAEHRSVSRIFT